MSVSPLRAATAALLAVLLAGCGGSPAPEAAPSTAGAASTTSAAAATSPTPTAAPTVAAAPGPAVRPAPAPVKLLPWPTTDTTRLQAAVDGGASPWLLDPTDLALSYVTATYDWTAADASPAAGTPAATKVDVRNADGERRALTVAQPGRKGNGGIWVVTGDSNG